MPGKSEFISAVQKGLNNLEVAKDEGDTVWTTKVKTELCKIGRRFGYSVYARANEVDEVYRDGGEWLYDVTWLEYKCNGDPERRLVLRSAQLVAECEWGGHEHICDDFEKLLLARASVRVMIFDGDHFNQSGGSSKWFAGRLAARVKEFEDSVSEDTWLLVSWERIASTDSYKWWRFRYFTIRENDLLELI